MASYNFGLEAYVNRLRKQAEHAIDKNNKRLEQLNNNSYTNASDDETYVDDEYFTDEDFNSFDDEEEITDEDFENFEDNNDNTLGGYVDTNTLYKVAIDVYERASEYTPVDTGTLKSSIYIKQYDQGFEIGYDCEYAIYVHEISFNQHEPPTQYKFLEDAAYEVQNEYRDVLDLDIVMKMEYNPLRLFIGVPDAPGQFITDIKYNEARYTSDDAVIQMYDFINSAPDFNNWSDEKINMYFKMRKFADYYYGVRHINAYDMLKEFGMRQRHN